MQRQRIYIEHDARQLAEIAGAERPSCDSVIANLGKVDQVLGCTLRANPLGDQWLLDATLPGHRCITWSGTLADDPFEIHPMTWGKPGHEALERFCDEVEPQLVQHGKRLCFHPHARHVLSDPQSCARFIKVCADRPFEIALAPASMLEHSMLRHVEDHLHRAFETLGSLCAMLILADVHVDESGESLKQAPLGDGVLPRDLLMQLIERHVPQDIPIVLQPGKVQEQLSWLGVAAA